MFFIVEYIGIIPASEMLLVAIEETLPNKITLICSGKDKIIYNEDRKSIKK